MRGECERLSRGDGELERRGELERSGEVLRRGEVLRGEVPVLRRGEVLRGEPRGGLALRGELERRGEVRRGEAEGERLREELCGSSGRGEGPGKSGEKLELGEPPPGLGVKVKEATGVRELAKEMGGESVGVVTFSDRLNELGTLYITLSILGVLCTLLYVFTVYVLSTVLREGCASAL